ncbi:MAG: hypothetical protein HY275_00820 [Gemmatimonadetes bacterium]|nr:hypothetical protein [Gemmatimonadota bacterium]
MRHFHRTHISPDAALAVADAFFPTIGLRATATAARSRTFAGDLGTLTLTAKPEGGHYTFLEAHTDQMGESRLDRNVKQYFVQVHNADDPRHAIEASY